jgi:hypothetical protein
MFLLSRIIYAQRQEYNLQGVLQVQHIICLWKWALTLIVGPVIDQWDTAAHWWAHLLTNEIIRRLWPMGWRETYQSASVKSTNLRNALIVIADNPLLQDKQDIDWHHLSHIGTLYSKMTWVYPHYCLCWILYVYDRILPREMSREVMLVGCAILLDVSSGPTRAHPGRSHPC